MRGAAVTDLFTSTWQIIPTGFQDKTITHAAPSFFVEAGDKLRLRLETWSPKSSAADTLFEYGWGGHEDYRSRTTLPLLFVGDCSDDPSRLTWDLLPFEQVDPQEELTLSFQGDAALDDGTFYNQASARYRSLVDISRPHRLDALHRRDHLGDRWIKLRFRRLHGHMSPPHRLEAHTAPYRP